MKNLSNDVIVHEHKDECEYIKFKRLLEYPEIKHLYTMRANNLNFRIYEDDSILQSSYEKICRLLNLDKKNIVKPHQTHTDRIETVKYINERFDEVDGVITDRKNIILCTTSADCTSFLFYDPVKKVIADIHSGWRGTIKCIGKKAVEKMIKEYRSNPEDIICCICPHIRKCHFEVDENVMNMFLDKFSSMKEIDKAIINGKIKNGLQKYYIDTTYINKTILKEVGLKESNILDSGICTVCEKEYFHSYRADKESSGRNAAIIVRG